MPAKASRKSLKERKSIARSDTKDTDASVTVELDTTNAAGDVTQKPKPKGYEQDAWELRMAQARRWGRTLVDTGGSDANSVRQLTKTLKDARVASQVALRRTAVEALVPAAAVGNRGALVAQAKALVDDNEVVRKTAFLSLRAAAGGKRAKQGGAVAVSLSDTLPNAAKLENVEARRAAASALARLAPAGEPSTIKLAIKWLDDSDPFVRCHAAKALSLVDPGKQSAVNALVARLDDDHWRVSKEAIGALEKIACEKKSHRPGSTESDPGRKGKDKGKDPARALAASCSDGKLRGLARPAAVASLGRAACPGDDFAIEAAADRLADVDVDVRGAAVKALATLGGKGGKEATLKAAAQQLTHSDFRVRDTAGKAMAEVSEVGDGSACAWAAAGLEYEDWGGRRGVAGALRRLGDQGEGAGRGSVFAVLVPRLEHPDWSIRRKAAQALGEVAKGTGDPRAMKLLLGMTKDPDDEVRSAVAAALPEAAPHKSKDAIVIATQFSQDSDPGIRLSALGAIEELASEDRSRSRLAVHSVAKCFEDTDEEVRRAAVRVMISIAKGRRTAIDVLATSFQHEDQHVREAAVAAFSGVAPAYRERAEKRAVPLMRNPRKEVREAATAAMQGMTTTAAEGGTDESTAIAAAAATVARFGRRFEAPRGHAIWEEQTFFSEGSSRKESQLDKECGLSEAEVPEGFAVVVNDVDKSSQSNKAGSRALSALSNKTGSRAPSAARSQAASQAPSTAPTMPVSLKASSAAGAQAMAQALLAGDLSTAAQLAEERRRQEEGEENETEEEVNSATDTESELSESDTDDDMAKAPERLTIGAATGGNSSTINGLYLMSEEAYIGKPQWQKADGSDTWLAFLDGQWFLTTQYNKMNQRKDGFLQSNQEGEIIPTEISEWNVKRTDGGWEVQPIEVFKDPPSPKESEASMSNQGSRRGSAVASHRGSVAASHRGSVAASHRGSSAGTHASHRGSFAAG